MHRWKTILAQGALAGSLTSLVSTAVLAMTGPRQGRAATATPASHPCTRLQDCAPGMTARRLSSGAMLGVCAAFALGLTAGTLALREQHRKEQQAKTPAQGASEAPPVVRRVRAGQMI